jgi:IS1 family transposase
VFFFFLVVVVGPPAFSFFFQRACQKLVFLRLPELGCWLVVADSASRTIKFIYGNRGKARLQAYRDMLKA